MSASAPGTAALIYSTRYHHPRLSISPFSFRCWRDRIGRHHFGGIL